MKKSNIFLMPLIIFIFFSCEKNEKGEIITDPVTEPPYDDPIWHPSGEIIGFNHMPIREIHQNKDRQYYWKFDLDSMGYWLINTDGTNMRRILPYYLNTPAWSPDGKWIAFSNNAQISIMPFDGEQFDTKAIQVLTKEGRNFFPAWSLDGKKIAFVQSVCDDTIQCGIWIYSLETNKSEFIIMGTDPCWSPQSDFLTYIENVYVDRNVTGNNIWIYDFKDKSSKIILHLLSPNLDNRYLRYSPDGTSIAFVSIMNDVEGIQLFKINSDGSGLTKLTSNGCTQFSWSPEGSIIYVNFYYKYIDETTGNLWTMDGDGGNKQPLTYNCFQIMQ